MLSLLEDAVQKRLKRSSPTPLTEVLKLRKRVREKYKKANVNSGITTQSNANPSSNSGFATLGRRFMGFPQFGQLYASSDIWW